MSFKDIKGHTKQIFFLQQDLRDMRLAGAYLFTGPEAIGKGLVAKALAKAVNCLQNSSDGCDSCISCRKIENNQHPDVHFIDKGYSQEIKIEDIRGLRQEASLRPYEARYKVFIINDSHNLNDESSNAFLKTLEEPPKHSVIILITDKPALLFRTVISRCKKIKFSALSAKELEGILRQDYSVDEGPLHYLAFFSEGRLGCALRLKDRDFLTEKNRIIDYFTLPSRGPTQENVIKDREQLRYDLQILAGWFRDIYLLKAAGKNTRLINQDRSQAISKLAEFYTFGALDEILREVSDALFYIERNVNFKLLVSQLRLVFEPAH